MQQILVSIDKAPCIPIGPAVMQLDQILLMRFIMSFSTSMRLLYIEPGYYWDW